MPKQSDERVIVAEPQSQALAALINFLFPSFGYLIQGRLFAFLAYWFLIAVGIVAGLVTGGVGFIVLPIVWILSIVDAAKYRPR